MRNRYTITMHIGEKDVCFSVKTHRDVADAINTAMGFPLVSQGIVVNWLSRGIKSNKYDFINITHTSMY